MKKRLLEKYLWILLEDIYGNINRRVQKIVILYEYIIEFKHYLEEERELKSVIFKKLDNFIGCSNLNLDQKGQFIRIKQALVT